MKVNLDLYLHAASEMSLTHPMICGLLTQAARVIDGQGAEIARLTKELEALKPKPEPAAEKSP